MKFYEILYSAIRKWRKDNKLLLIEAYKGRTVFKIEMQKIDKMVKQEVNKKERNSEEKIAASATLFWSIKVCFDRY